MSCVIIIVLDGVGVGALPDAGKYNDNGANSLGNMLRELSRLREVSPLKELPNLAQLGIFNLISNFQFPTHPVANRRFWCGVPNSRLIGSYGKMSEKSNAKDTNVGHWELMGVVTEKPFPTY
ncbi:MAG: hypothetical protein QME68_03340, partial [Elusimicrobiota bacterium]|nr:hypothetical protein [Elusimicrobiota bacterium]